MTYSGLGISTIYLLTKDTLDPIKGGPAYIYNVSLKSSFANMTTAIKRMLNWINTMNVQ